MHNNSPPINRTHVPKPFYTVVEAAVQWAKSDGAKSAGSPLISQYSQWILAALKDGTLRATLPDDVSAAEESPSFAYIIALADLKEWLVKYHPKAKPKFLFGKG